MCLNKSVYNKQHEEKMHDSEYWERVVRSEMKAFKFNSVQIEMGRKEYEILV